MSNIRKSLVLSFAQRNSTLLIQFVSSLIIARLLTPHEIGVFSIGAVIVSFSHILRDMGVSNYVIQERELTPERLRSAQAIVWITGLTLALLLFVFSEFAGEFYSEPGVTLTMRVLSINFLLLPVGSVTSALLTREMEFGKLFIVNITTALTRSLSGIWLAWVGFGFISLAWSAVAGAIVTAIGMTLCRQRGQPWFPGFSEWRRVFSRGSKLSVTSIFQEVGLGGPDLVTGRLLGFEVVAYFSRGFGAAALALQALVDSTRPVAFSYFANQARSGGDLEEPYLRGISYMSVLSFSAFSGLAIMAEPIIFLLYGAQWLNAVLPLQIICFSMSFLAISNVSGALLVGSGEIDVNMKAQMIFQPAKVVMVGIGALMYGLPGVAAGVVVGDVAISFFYVVMANRVAGVKNRKFLLVLMPSLWVAIACSCVCFFGKGLLVGVKSEFMRVFINCSFMLIVWFLGLFCVQHPLWQELRRLIRSDA